MKTFNIGWPIKISCTSPFATWNENEPQLFKEWPQFRGWAADDELRHPSLTLVLPFPTSRELAVHLASQFTGFHSSISPCLLGFLSVPSRFSPTRWLTSEPPLTPGRGSNFSNSHQTVSDKWLLAILLKILSGWDEHESPDSVSFPGVQTEKDECYVAGRSGHITSVTARLRCGRVRKGRRRGGSLLKTLLTIPCLNKTLGVFALCRWSLGSRMRLKSVIQRSQG